MMRSDNPRSNFPSESALAGRSDLRTEEERAQLSEGEAPGSERKEGPVIKG